MAWPHLDGIIKVRMTYGFDGRPSVNIHFVLQRTPASPIPEAELEAAAFAFTTSWGFAWDDRAHTEWTLDAVKTIDWSEADGIEFDQEEFLPVVGLGAVGDPSPASVTLVASHRTGRTGRSRRGRNYIPGLAQAEVDGNDASQGLVTDIASVYTRLATELDLADMDLVVYSLVTGGAKRVVPIATLVTSTIVNSGIDTQRRRLS